MSDQSVPENTGTDEPAADMLWPLLDHWLTHHNLTAIYYDPVQQGAVPFADHVARALGVTAQDTPAVTAALAEQVAAYLHDQHLPVSQEAQTELVTRMRSELLGMSVLDEAWNDPDVFEIMVNGPYQIFIERRGRTLPYERTFAHPDHLLRTIQRILLSLGERVDPRTPIMSTRLPDGTLLSVVFPPVALNGPCLTIRKFRRDSLTIADLIRFGSVTPEMAEFLDACVRARLNIIVAGGTGGGKTTVMNVLAQFIPADERIVTVEEVAEFQLKHNHVIALQSQLPDSTGMGGVTVRDLVRTVIQMRPERIMLGELNGPEAFDALHMIGRGHDGSMLAMFANHPEQVLEQLEMMIKFNQPDLPVPYLRTLMGANIDLIVQLNRLSDGSRKITHISEVLPDRAAGYTLHHVYMFQQTGENERGKIRGEFRSQPVSPTLAAHLQALHIFLPGLIPATAGRRSHDSPDR